MALTTQVGLEFIARNRASRQISSFNRSIARMGRQMLAIAGVGGGIYAIQRGFKSIIKAASDAQETQAKFDTVFKNLSKQANTWAGSFGKSVGRSNESVKSWMAGLQDTFVPLGIARDEALELAQSLTTLAVDVASFNNAADATVIRDFTSALVGNHETVRKYGIIISENAMKQEAMRRGMAKTYAQLTDLEKVQLRYQLILKGTTDAQGDALRTADSYANKVKRLYANINDLKVSMGDELVPVFSDFVTLLIDNEKNLVAFSKAILAPVKSLLYLIDILNALHEVQKSQPGPSYGWGTSGFKLNYPSKLPSLPEATTLPAGPKAAKYDYMTTFPPVKKPELPAWVEETVQREEEVGEIAKKYMPALRTEIALTGKLGEARAHARQVMKLENDLREKGLEKSAEGIRLMERQAYWLKELEKAQRLARIADDIGASFANAFEDMIFEAKKFDEVMRSIIRSIARSVMQNLIFQPMGLAISGAISGGLSGLFGRSAGAAQGAFSSPHGGPALQYGGTVEETGWAKVHKGETYSGVGGGGNVVINIDNRGQPLNVMGYEQRDVEDQRIIDIVVDNAQGDGPVRRMVQEVIANVE